MRRIILAKMILGMVSASIALPALAQQLALDVKKPIEINADSLEVLQKEQKAIFAGNVIATQDKLRLNADVMRVHYRANKGNRQESEQAVSRIEVEGNVFLDTQEETARSKEGVYDVDKNTITLMGNVVLTRGENVVKGENLEYDLVTGRSKVIGSGGISASTTTTGSKPGRVRGLFVPEQTQDEAK